MANEVTLVYKTENPINFIVSNSTGIEKGTLLKIADPMTASACSALNDVFAGIAASEKIASDGRTELGVFRRGIFRGTASGAITCGDMLVAEGASGVNTNYIRKRNSTTMSGAIIIGTALETAADGETLLFELNITGVGSDRS